MNRYTSTSTYVYECLFFFVVQGRGVMVVEILILLLLVFFLFCGGFFIFNVVYVEKLKICTHIVLFQKKYKFFRRGRVVGDCEYYVRMCRVVLMEKLKFILCFACYKNVWKFCVSLWVVMGDILLLLFL